MNARRYLVAATVAALLAGCSTTEAGTATPASPGGEDFPTAPHVPEPLDITPYLEDPCALVPGNAPDQLGYDNKDATLPKDSSSARLTGPSCDWHAKERGGILQVVIASENRTRGTGGLHDVYQGHYVTGQYSYLEPLEIDGYPAAYADVSDGRAQGSVTLFVGVAEDMAVAVNIGPLGDGKKVQAEDGARTIAEVVVKTLKSGR